ncbi:unnamed protein product [Malus baccata var. baccata]
MGVAEMRMLRGMGGHTRKDKIENEDIRGKNLYLADGSERTQFPAQVQIRVLVQCQPVLESQFKAILVDNYYSQRNFWFELDHAQTSKHFNLTSRVVKGEDTSLSGVVEDHDVINELTLEDIDNPREPCPHSSSDLLIQEVEWLKAFKIQEVEEVMAFETEFTDQSKKIDHLEHKLLEFGSTPSKAHTDEKDTESWNVLHCDPDESIYLVGEYDGESCSSTFDAYYPSEDMMKPLRPISAVCAYASVAQLYGDLYVIGGGNGQCPSLREKKGSLAAATTNNKIFAMGGGNGVDCFSDVEMLDLDMGRWIYTQSMLQKRMALAAVELKGVLYATGGYDGNSYLNFPISTVDLKCSYLSSVDRFDPRERSWTKIASMHSKRSCHSSVVLDEKIVESFDPRLGAWMPAEPMYFPRGYSAAAVVKDTIYVIGGMKDNETITETVEYYEGQDWREMATMTIGRRCFMSAAASST